MKFLKKISIIVILACINPAVQSQTILIDTTFTTDGEIYPFSQNDTAYGIRMSGDIVLNSDTSLVRVIFSDTNYNEYMVYEAYPLISSKYSFSVNNVYDETYCLDEVVPYSIRIEIINASFTLDQIIISSEECTNSEQDRYTAKRTLDDKKIDTMNVRIDDFGMEWISSDNSEVAMYYEEKVDLYGQKYNILGYDYYGGGVYEVIGHMDYVAENSSYTVHFDWRKRHDADDTSSMYWDNQADTSGWMTKHSEQGDCGSCWVFGPIAVFEGLVNLYFNDHLDFDLSEQHLFSCSAQATCETGGEPSEALEYGISHGSKTEDCFPYYGENADNYNCNDTCNYSDTLIFADTLIGITKTNLDSIKKALINNGPLSVIVDVEGSPVDHAMALVGYRMDFQDSVTIWIFKDSRSSHFYREKHRDGLIKEVIAVLVPIEVYDSNTTHQYEVNCFDKDGDGYYWWGIGAKPDTCPDFPDEPDCNDNNALIGPCDSCYNEVCNYQYETENIHIDRDTTWASDQIIENTIYVDSGYTLTIKSEIKFVKHSGIIVKQGGRLHLYGATLTKACHDLWNGIEVWGRYDTTQYYSNFHGMVRIDSNSLIEYAEIALIAGSENVDTDPYYMRAGGIIKAKNSHFRNNTVDVEFYPYRNLHPNNNKIELPNSSKFEKCLFETDNKDLYYYYPPDKHVILSQVKGVDFFGCRFIGTELEDVHYFLDREIGYGIYSTGSSFKVDDFCSSQATPCPESSLTQSEFKNLRYGVYAVEWDASRLITIKGSDFENNICGIYLSGTTNSSIVLNNVDINPSGVSNSFKDTICGIYIDDCTGYQIEEDSISSGFTLSFSADNNYVGLYIKNSGIANNEVYNNEFTGNYYATIVEGVNRGDSTGLCIKCNDYYTNKNDIFIVPDTSLKGTQYDQGIAEYQGTPSDSTTTGPAGNTFTEYLYPADTINFKYFNYLNDTTEYFNYLHHNYSIENPRIYPKNVNDSTELILFHFMNLDFDKDLSCPSSFDNTGSIEELKGSLESENSNIESLSTDISLSLDGGNTTNLLNDVHSSGSSQSIALRQQLLNDSPYLSDTVISASIDNEDALPSPFIRDVLIANPHSPKQEEHLNQLDQRSNLLPEYMKQEIINQKYSLDALDLLVSNKRAWENQRDRTLNSLARQYMDTTNAINPADSIISMLEDEYLIGRKLELAFLSLNQNDTAEARNMVNSITSLFSLTPTQDSIIANYNNLINLLIKQKANVSPDSYFDSITATCLFSIYFKKLPGISKRAGNLLVAGGYLDIRESIYIPKATALKSGMNWFQSNESAINEMKMELAPNPAKDYAIVSYKLEETFNYGILEIIDLSGNLIHSLNLHNQEDEIFIGTNRLSPGLYLIRIITNNLSHSKKLVVIK